MSLDGLKSLIYKIANGYVMEVRHQTVVTYTLKLSSDGPITPYLRGLKRLGETVQNSSANSTYKSAVLNRVRNKVTTST